MPQPISPLDRPTFVDKMLVHVNQKTWAVIIITILGTLLVSMFAQAMWEGITHKQITETNFPQPAPRIYRAVPTINVPLDMTTDRDQIHQLVLKKKAPMLSQVEWAQLVLTDDTLQKAYDDKDNSNKTEIQKASTLWTILPVLYKTYPAPDKDAQIKLGLALTEEREELDNYMHIYTQMDDDTQQVIKNQPSWAPEDSLPLPEPEGQTTRGASSTVNWSTGTPPATPAKK